MGTEIWCGLVLGKNIGNNNNTHTHIQYTHAHVHKHAGTHTVHTHTHTLTSHRRTHAHIHTGDCMYRLASKKSARTGCGPEAWGSSTYGRAQGGFINHLRPGMKPDLVGEAGIHHAPAWVRPIGMSKRIINTPLSFRSGVQETLLLSWSYTGTLEPAEEWRALVKSCPLAQQLSTFPLLPPFDAVPRAVETRSRNTSQLKLCYCFES